MPGWGHPLATGENPDSLGGRYQLIAKLGAGGMCEVFLASSRGLGSFHKLVVIKRMLGSTAMVPGSKRMFMDEAEITARFNHPNIVQTFEILSEDDHLSIVMEYLEGQPLNHIFELLENEDVSGSLLAQRDVWVRVIADALKGLHYAHELRDYDGQPLNIVHRDISPQNLFFTYDGVVKIVDFGIAKAARSSIKTEAGTIKGKIEYMAPEQALGAPVDRRTDVFSMGLVLWEFLTGTYLRSGEPVRELQRLVSESTPPLSNEVADVPSVLEAIVSKATARNPQNRYATAEEMRLELEGYLAGQNSTLKTAEVGQAIAKHFEHQRQFLRDRIREVVSGTPPGGASQTKPKELVDLSSIRTVAATSGVFSGGRTPPQTPTSSRRRKVIVAIVVAAAAAVVALWVVPTVTSDTQADAVAATGAITIESVPPSASVRLDGVERGTTPITARVAAGVHRVTVFKAGFAEASSSVETKEGETVKVSLVLSPSPAPRIPPEPSAKGEGASDEQVGDETVDSDGPGKPERRPRARAGATRAHAKVPSEPVAPKAAPKPPTANPAPKARPTPRQPNIQIIDESSEAKVKVDVIE